MSSKDQVPATLPVNQIFHLRVTFILTPAAPGTLREDRDSRSGFHWQKRQWKYKAGRSSAAGTDMKFTGSGNFAADEGSVKSQTIHLSGSGNANTYGLKTETCDANLSGSGNIKVTVSSFLEARITGSGNIDYRGDAQVKKIAVHGSGRINKKG